MVLCILSVKSLILGGAVSVRRSGREQTKHPLYNSCLHQRWNKVVEMGENVYFFVIKADFQVRGMFKI